MLHRPTCPLDLEPGPIPTPRPRLDRKPTEAERRRILDLASRRMPEDQIAALVHIAYERVRDVIAHPCRL